MPMKIFNKSGPVDGRTRDKSKRGLFFAITISAIIMVDFILIILLSRFTRLSIFWIAVVNSGILGIITFPILNLRFFKPLDKRHRRISEALLEAEQKSQSILKTAANLIISLNENGIIIDCNIRSVNILGYSPRGIIGEPITKIIHPDYLVRARKSLRTIVMDQTLLNEELKMVKRDGSVIDVSINSSSLRDRFGKFVMAIWIVDDITERKQVEESSRLLRFSIERSLDAVYWVGPDANLIHVNEAACKALGYSRDELLKMTVHDIDTLFTKDVWLPHWIDLRNRRSFMVETKHKTKSGRVFPVEIAVNYVEFEGKEYNCAFARDITERKRTETELRAVNEQLKTSIEQMPLAYILWDTGYRLMEWNRAAERIFGFKRQEVLGKQLPDLVIPFKYRFQADKIFQQLAEGVPSSFSMGNNNIRKDGVLISCNWHNTPLKGKDGRVFAVLSMVEDVTEQARVRKELKAVNEKFREITEMLPQAVFEIDMKGNFTYANRHGFEFSGYSPGETRKGLNAAELIAPDEREKLKAQQAKILRGEKVYGVEFVMRRKNGADANIVIFANPIFGGEHVIGARGIAVDITESKRLQDLISRAQKLEIAGRIAGQVAHDFNNLLGPLSAFPEFIRESLPPDSPAIDYLYHIEKAADRMAEINQQLLTFGRRGHYSHVPLNLNEIIRQTLSGIGSLPDTVRLKTDLADDLRQIKGGAAQISLLITNLINNACEAMENSGELLIKTENYYVDKLWSKYGRVPSGEYIKFTIADNGCGIDESVLPRIFEPFYTTKSAASKRGSGLGLSIVHSIVEDHGGYIDVKSEVGKGTSLYVYFPVSSENAASEDPGDVIGGDEKILVVDDDALQREVTLCLLRKLGYDSSGVESGEKAVEFIKKNPQNLVLLDMVMDPGMDGAETYRKISRINPGQKAIIISGYADSDRIETALKMGVSGFVRKPLTLRTLSRAVRAALEGKKVNA